MKTYETVVILDSSMPDEQVDERIERFRKILTGGGEAPFQVDRWGKRKLAYPIGKKELGFYAVLRYDSTGDAIAEFDRVARIDEQVLRHLTVVNPVEPAPAGAPAGGAERSAREDEES